jgi:hypothetical protein
MSDYNSVRRFEYRTCRIETGFTVDFRSGEKTISGVCRNVSDTGIRAVLNGPVVIGSSGLLALRHPTGALQLEAQIAYIENGQAGIIFLFRTAWERGITSKFIASIANQSADLLVVRLP